MSYHEFVLRDGEDFCPRCRRAAPEARADCRAATCPECPDEDGCLEEGRCRLTGDDL